MKAARAIAKQCLGAAVSSRPFKSFLKLIDYQLAPYKEREDPSEDSLAAHLAIVFHRYAINCVLDVAPTRDRPERHCDASMQSLIPALMA